MLAKVFLARFFAVLISGTLVAAPFSCCCASVDSQQLEAHLQSMATPSMATMAGMSHDTPADQAPDGKHACPHKLTASLDAAKWVAKTAVAAPYPLIHVATVSAEGRPYVFPAHASLAIRPPPRQAVTLVSQHVLLLI